jgi:TrkA domain protein
VRLAGVGTRVDFVDEDGRAFTVVNRDDGEVEIYLPGDRERTTLRLADDSARALGALLAGRFEMAQTLTRRTGRLLGGLAFDWVTVPAGSPAVKRSIADLEIRRRTGATVVAILRGQIPIVAPEPDTRLEAGDDVVIASRPNDIAGARRYLEHGR